MFLPDPKCWVAKYRATRGLQSMNRLEGSFHVMNSLGKMFDPANRDGAVQSIGDGSKPWYLLFTPSHSWVKMDVHPTIVMYL